MDARFRKQWCTYSDSDERYIEMFAKPKPKKTVATKKKSPLPLRANVSSKAAKKPRKKIARKKKSKR